MPLLHIGACIEYDKVKILLSTYRYSYAQRHAEADVPVEVLGEPMSHRKLDTVKSSTTPLHCSSTDTATAYGASPHLVGFLARPPRRRQSSRPIQPLTPNRPTLRTDPFRFRCAGHDYFRTDVSYLPDLHS